MNVRKSLILFFHSDESSIEFHPTHEIELRRVIDQFGRLTVSTSLNDLRQSKNTAVLPSD